MALLAGVAYDPAVAVSKATTALQAMTALDTTNLRLTFSAPQNGSVLIRMRYVVHGGSIGPMLLLGVLDGATVIARAAPIGTLTSSSGTSLNAREALFVVTGLTPTQSYTWDAAYGVEVIATSTNIKYGGPNDTTTNNAFGAFSFEVWEAANLLGAALYDPAVAVTKATDTALAMTALDTTNLRLTFTAPSSGSVLVRMRCAVSGNTGTKPMILLGVLDGATVRGRGAGGSATMNPGAAAATDHFLQDAEFLVTGLTPSQSYTWDAAYSVETVLVSTAIKYGGPDDATGDNAWGGFAYEIWGS